MNIKTNSSRAIALTIVGSLMVLAFVSIPASSYAATYAYVNTSGNLAYVEANSSSEAFAGSVNIDIHSGVMLTGGAIVVATVNPVTNTANISGYLYVNSFGKVVFVDVNSSTAAFLNSINIDQNSGVMVITSTSDQNMIGDSVAVN